MKKFKKVLFIFVLIKLIFFTYSCRPYPDNDYTESVKTAPVTPSGIHVVAASEQLTVTWNVVSGAEHYTLYCDTGNDYSSAAIVIENITAPTVIIPGLQNGTIYNIWLKAFNRYGSSGVSTVQSISTIMPAPGGVSVTGKLGNIQISWNSISSAAYYDVYYNTTNSAPVSPYITNNSGTTATISGLDEGRRYYVWIKAKGNSGNYSDFSNAVNCVTMEAHSGGSVSFNMAYVPAGTFTLQNGGPNMTISKSYWIAETEVTQELFEEIMGAGNNPSYFNSGADSGEVQVKRPVENVNFYHAIVFCNKLSIAEEKMPVYEINGYTDPNFWGTIPTSDDSMWNNVTANWNADGYRLPTAMEWMWAAMGARDSSNGYAKACAGSTGSNNIGDYVWYDVNSNAKTHEVGKKLPNELGLCDMNGNVREICWDASGESYPTVDTTDYWATADPSYHKNRSGSWKDDETLCLIADYGAATSWSATNDLGLRIVTNAPSIP